MKTVVDLITSLKAYILGKDAAAKQAVEQIIAPVETDAAASAAAYSVGDQIILNDVLYDVTAAISIGDALAVGTNISASDDISEQISSKQDQIEVTTMPTASASNVGKVLIYIGTTTASYTSGQSYQCVEESGSYSWQATSGGATSAANVTYDNTSSGMTADNVQEAVDELNTDLSSKEDAPTTLTATLATGATTLTFTNSAIGNNSRIRAHSDPFILGFVTNMTQSGTTVTLTCAAQSSAVSVMLEVRN